MQLMLQIHALLVNFPWNTNRMLDKASTVLKIYPNAMTFILFSVLFIKKKKDNIATLNESLILKKTGCA